MWHEQHLSISFLIYRSFILDGEHQNLLILGFHNLTSQLGILQTAKVSPQQHGMFW